MAEKPKTDPIEVWRDMVGQWEKSVNELAAKTTTTPEFAKTMNEAAGFALGLRNSMGELIGRYLTALNLPSRDEMVGIGEQLRAIQDQLSRIATLLEQRGGPEQPSVPKPPRTKRPSNPGATQ